MLPLNPLISLGKSGGYPPTRLFTNGEAGIYLYPQDTASLFQDAAGTIPATAEDDPVGLILDKRPASGAMRLYGGSTNIAAGDDPFSVAISPDGASVYVANYNSNTVSIYTRSESGVLTSVGTIAAGNRPYSVAVPPDGASVYVANRDSDKVSIYTRAEDGSLTSAGTIAAGDGPYSVTVSPDGASVYVANLYSDNVSIYARAESGALTSAGTIAAGDAPFSVTASPDGASVYVANAYSNVVSIYTRAESGTLTSAGTIASGNGPRSVAVSPDGTSVYVANLYSDNVSIYTRAEDGSLTSAGTIAAGDAPRSVAVSPDGASVYVANLHSDNVSIYTRAESGALTPAGTIAAGGGPRSVAISPDGASVYVANRDSDNVSIYKRSAGNHAYQTTSTKRALLKYTDSGVLGLYYDGIDDCYQAYDIDFSATDEMTVFAGVQKRSAMDSAVADSVCELSAAFDSNNGAFAVWAPGINYQFSYITKGTLIGRADASNPVQYAIPDPFVLTGESKISTDTCQLSLNGELVQSTTLDQGTGNYGNYPLNIGSRNQSSTFFKGFLSALIIRGKSVTPSQKRGIEQWISIRQRGYESLPAIGVPYGGGFVAGYISVAGNGVADHMLIVSPKASGETCDIAWDTVGGTTTGFTSFTDGPTNSAGLAALGSRYAAATFCEGLTINGYSDWYLPARNELEVAYYNLKNVTDANVTYSGGNANAVPPWEPVSTTYTATRPAQTTVDAFKVGGVEAFAVNPFWSSSESYSLKAWYHLFDDDYTGFQVGATKTLKRCVRAFRRISL